MSLADKAIDHVTGVEGDYSNHASDLGGRTRFGITEFVARRNGYTGAMQDLPHELARAIYKAEYWDALSLDEIALQSFPIAEELFDTAVNIGTGRAAAWFQTALNVFNRRGIDYPDIPIDERIGPATAGALKALLNKRGQSGEKILLRALNAQQGAHYLNISTARPANEDFTAGWFLNRVRL